MRWQIIRRKGQDELLLGSVHPYPSDEQELKIKQRPAEQEEEWCRWCGMMGHMWGDCPDEDLDAEKLKGCPRESDYPEKDGWRDKAVYEEEYHRQMHCWTDVWGEERRLLEYSSISKRRRKKVRRQREELCSEWTGEHLQGRYKSNLYTVGLQPGVIKENNRAEKKLEEEPEDDSCSQATTASGLSRSAAFSGTDSGVKKNKKRQAEAPHV